MQKFFSYLVMICTCLMFVLSGCSKKSTQIILTEPVQEGEELSVKSEVSEEADKTSEDTVKVEDVSEEPEATTDASSEKIMVHVCGAVLSEGVYELAKGSRVVDAVEAAGGFGPDADSSYVNQAKVLEDGIKLKIPTMEETAQLAEEPEISDGDPLTVIDGEEPAASSEGGKVNINTASETELCSIPGIGPGRAKNILTYREQNGSFKSIEDIMKVSGIKDKFFSKIKDYITV